MLHLLLTLTAPAFAQDPNILLIITDDVGVDKVSAYKGDYPRYALNASNIPDTPTLDSLADAGLRFTDAWSNPVCSPTRAGIMTGRHGFRTGVSNVVQDGDAGLATSEVVLAEVLHGDTDGDGVQDVSVDYAVGLFGKWHLGDDGFVAPLSGPSMETGTAAPVQHGWDRYTGNMSGEITDYWSWSYISSDTSWLHPTYGTPYFWYYTTTDYATRETGAFALDWITEQTGPWFATVAFNAGHWDESGWDTDHALEGCSTITSASNDIESFQAAVECMDNEINTLLTGIDALGQLENTVIIFVGDNGTDQDVTEDAFANGRGKGTTYENGIRVPLIVADGATWLEWVNSGTLSDGYIVDPGRTVTHPVHTVDLFATVADIAGVTATSGDDSVSFYPYFSDSTAAWERTGVYTEKFDPTTLTGKAAYRRGRYKLVMGVSNPGVGYLCRNYEMYDIEADPFERRNLKNSRPGIFNGTKAALNNYVATNSITWLNVPDCP